MKLTNEEIARVYAMYFGGTATIMDENDSYIGMSGKIIEIGTRHIVLKTQAKYESECSFIDVKLSLTPLSSITDEHAIEVGSLYFGTSDSEYHLKWGKSIIEGVLEKGYLHTDFTVLTSINQYLIQQAYAVPLFFGVNHWANGKTAIELNIAIDKALNQ